MMNDFTDLDAMVEALAQKLAVRRPRNRKEGKRTDAPHEEWDAVKNELKRIVNERAGQLKASIAAQGSPPG